MEKFHTITNCKGIEQVPQHMVEWDQRSSRKEPKLIHQGVKLIKIESDQKYYFDLDQNFPL